MPPATTTSASPERMSSAPRLTAFSALAQTLLTVNAETVAGRPARSAAWRAGTWPCPAGSTVPMITWSTPAGSTPLRSTTSRMTRAPRSTAGTAARAPPRRPNGVRAAATITASRAMLSILPVRRARYSRMHLDLVRAQEMARDEDALHLARPLADLVDLDVAVVAGDRRLLHEPVAAVDL